MDARSIIYDYLTEQLELNDLILGLCNYLDVDTLVGWFYDEYFQGDDDALIKCMGEKNGNAIIDYYNDHCA